MIYNFNSEYLLLILLRFKLNSELKLYFSFLSYILFIDLFYNLLKKERALLKLSNALSTKNQL
ncbi:hypothetical protein FBBAL38_11394 [Flavobacteria bacterium BAL38]|jgi:hypothetical protein|nr:hypothetical protein FBBAL38_11394 [Flavobacteria bacterium BAL38]